MSAASRSGRGVGKTSSKVVRSPAASVSGNFVSSSDTRVDRPIGSEFLRQEPPLVVTSLCRQCDGCGLVQARYLCTLEMPVVDGWEATRRLKGNPKTCDIPVIAFSAHALAGERERALAAGCDEFDTKPIEFDRLVAKLRRILAVRENAQSRG
jgi:two-component system, cell cycle response regulator DivK